MGGHGKLLFGLGTANQKGNRTITCPYCDRKFKEYSYKGRHSIDKNDKIFCPYTCPKCHSKNYHWKCQDCGYNFADDALQILADKQKEGVKA